MRYLKLSFRALRGPLHDMDLEDRSNRDALVLYELLFSKYNSSADPGFPFREVMIIADPDHMELALPAVRRIDKKRALRVFAGLGLLSDGETLDKERITA